MAKLSPLRRRMIEDMTVRNLSPSSLTIADRGRQTSIRYRQRKGTRTHHPSVSRSRRHTPS
jgi:hypothetical protein